MIENTFLHLPGVGASTELRFWKEGLVTWEDFLDRGVRAVGVRQYDRLAPLIETSRRVRNQARYFSERLKSGDRWRLYGSFQSVCFLDIETFRSTGDFDEVTLIGLFDWNRYWPFISGEKQERFQDRLKNADLLVTFNGTLFDLPVLEYRFPGFRCDAAHLDLLHICRKAELRGGLKRIEQTLGIHRPEAVAGMDGYEAVKLWKAYLDGNQRALELLVQYNREDTRNLGIILDWVYEKLRRDLSLAAGTILSQELPLRPGWVLSAFREPRESR